MDLSTNMSVSNTACVSLEEALEKAFGRASEIVERKRLYGGDINDAYMLRLSGGQRVFMKTNSVRNYGFFAAEEQGLNALRSAGVIGVPELLGTGTDRRQGFSFLLLEYMESAPQVSDYWEIFGRQLARLHRADCGGLVPAPSTAVSACSAEAAPREESLSANDVSGMTGTSGMTEASGMTVAAGITVAAGNTDTDEGAEWKYGFVADNYIGAAIQINTPKKSWVEFFRECRLLPQLRMADRYLDAGLRRKADRLLAHLDRYLREPEFPSLVHGDLWGGNVLCGSDGRAWLIDPAAYVGDFETDLAMTELFGRFPPAFYRAYQEENPVDGEYQERKPIYQLYHLLNHLNLFGRSYLGSVEAILGAM